MPMGSVGHFKFARLLNIIYFSFISVLTSGLEAIYLKPPKRPILLSGFRSAVTSHNNNINFYNDFYDDDGSGALAIDAATGEQIWRRSLYAEPSAHACDLLDIDSDGNKDCIVVGAKGLMAALNPIHGEQICRTCKGYNVKSAS